MDEMRSKYQYAAGFKDGHACCQKQLLKAETELLESQAREIKLRGALTDALEKLNALHGCAAKGYDWNADSLSITLTMGQASDARQVELDRLTRENEKLRQGMHLTISNAGKDLIAERDALKIENIDLRRLVDQFDDADTGFCVIKKKGTTAPAEALILEYKALKAENTQLREEVIRHLDTLAALRARVLALIETLNQFCKCGPNDTGHCDACAPYWESLAADDKASDTCNRV